MRSYLLPVPLLLAAAVGAQSTIVPSAHATKPPDHSPFYIAYVFYSTSSATTPHDSHSQLIYDMNDIAAPAAVWNSMDVRRPSKNSSNTTLGNSNPACTTNATIMVSMSSTGIGSVTNTFASNHGAMPTTVFNGPLSLPARPSQSTWPAPWENIPFSTPLVFVNIPNGTLVVDVMQTGNTGTSSWYLEAQTPFTGDRITNGGSASSCKFSNGKYNSGLSYRRPLLGGTWYVQYNNLLPNVMGFAWLGAQGAGGSYAGLPLPIDLGPFGATGCRISASADYIIPLTATGTSAKWPTINIPNNPSLGGASFYDHSLWLDPAANAFGVVTGWSSQWVIGDNLGAPAALLYAAGSSAANPTGSLQNGTGVTLQFNQ